MLVICIFADYLCYLTETVISKREICTVKDEKHS